MIFVTRLRLHEGRCLPVLIWLCFWFSSICSGEISQNVHNLCNLSCRSFESQKNWDCRGSILTICNFAFFPLSQILVLRIFWQEERNKYCSKDPYFLCCKILRNEIEVRQDLYLSVRTLSRLSPFGNLSHRVYCLADFFFTRRRTMNITGVVAGTHRFHDIKTVFY